MSRGILVRNSDVLFKSKSVGYIIFRCQILTLIMIVVMSRENRKLFSLSPFCKRRGGTSRPRDLLVVSASESLSRLEKFHIWTSATLSRLGIGMLFRSRSRPRHLFPFILPMSANSFPHVHSMPTTQLSMNKPIWP
jgi:hypothetical protein